jgi:thioredoxin 1
MAQLNLMLNVFAIAVMMAAAGVWVATPGPPKPLPNDAQFVAQIQQPGTVLVKFGAEWCPPCREIEKELDALAKSASVDVTVVKLDMNQNRALAEHYHVSRIPCLILFKNGKEVGKTTGYHSREQMQTWIASTR